MSINNQEQVNQLKEEAKSLLGSLLNIVGGSSSQYEFRERVVGVDRLIDMIINVAVLESANRMSEALRLSTTLNELDETNTK